MCHEENNEGKHYCSNKVLDGKGILLLAFEFSITSYFFNHLKGLFFSPSVYVLEYILDNYIQIFPRPSLGFLILSICSMLTWTLLMVRNASRSLLVGNHLSFHRTLREDCRAYRSFQPSRDMVQSWEYASRVTWAAALLSIYARNRWQGGFDNLIDYEILVRITK